MYNVFILGNLFFNEIGLRKKKFLVFAYNINEVVINSLRLKFCLFIMTLFFLVQKLKNNS